MEKENTLKIDEMDADLDNISQKDLMEYLYIRLRRNYPFIIADETWNENPYLSVIYFDHKNYSNLYPWYANCFNFYKDNESFQKDKNIKELNAESFRQPSFSIFIGLKNYNVLHMKKVHIISELHFYNEYRKTHKSLACGIQKTQINSKYESD